MHRCDLQEIIGSAIAFQVLFGLPLWVGCLITFTDTLTFLGIHYFGVRKLEAVFIVLVRHLACGRREMTRCRAWRVENEKGWLLVM